MKSGIVFAAEIVDRGEILELLNCWDHSKFVSTMREILMKEGGFETLVIEGIWSPGKD